MQKHNLIHSKSTGLGDDIELQEFILDKHSISEENSNIDCGNFDDVNKTPCLIKVSDK